tara:strand:+ start:9311 stop:9652 length:342 start_codon:yes stop_codon:yes gene_type:complete
MIKYTDGDGLIIDERTSHIKPKKYEANVNFGYVSFPSSNAFINELGEIELGHKATDLEKLKQCLDDIGFKFDEITHCHSISLYTEEKDNIHEDVEFARFNKDGSILSGALNHD